MNLAIVGSRNFTDYPLFCQLLEDAIQDIKVHTVISGGARGVDTMAEQWANDNKRRFVVHLPQWNRYGKSAGPIRNRKIIQDSDQVIAFWDGESRGTQSSIQIAKRLSKPCHIIMYKDFI